MKKLSTLATATALVLATAGASFAAGPTIVKAEAEPVAQPKAASGGLGLAGILLGAAAIGVAAAIIADDNGGGSSTSTTTAQ